MITQTEVRYYEFGEYLLDMGNYQLLKNNEPIPLTHKSIEILYYLVQNRGKTLGKHEFFKNIWAESFVDDSNLTQHIYRIRKALEDTENGETYIETIPKYGYRFNADVIEIADSSNFSQNSQEFNVETDENSELVFNKDSSINPEANFSNLDKNKKLSKKNSSLEYQKLIVDKKSSSAWLSFIDKKVVLTLIFGIITTLALSQLYFFVSSNTNLIIEPYTSVAVFPFKYIGKEKDEKLELGVADTLISKLGNLKAVSVIPTESILPFTNNDFQENKKDLYEIGKKLDADVVLTGTIQRENNTVRFSIKYYDIKKHRQLCTAKFDEEFSDTFTLQDSISEKATKKLLLELKAHMNSAVHNINDKQQSDL